MTSGERTLVEVRARGGITLLTLANPPVNAMTEDLVSALEAATQAVAADPRSRVVVITGSGRKAFAAGIDPQAIPAILASAPGGAGAAGEAEWLLRCLSAVFSLPQPVIAALQSSAVGAGFQLAMACDLVVADARAQIGLSELRLGLAPPTVGIMGLVRRVGLARATEMVLLGRLISARRAVELGLIAEVAPEGMALERAYEFADSLAALPAGVVRDAKAALRGGRRVQHDGSGRAHERTQRRTR